MIAAKIATCLLGLALLLPLGFSFWIMATQRPKSQAELQKALDEALAVARADIDAALAPGFPGAMAARVQVTDQINIPTFSPRFWSPYPRRWVGMIGFLCIVTIAGLWIYSSFFPRVTLSGEYGREGAQLPDPVSDPFKGSLAKPAVNNINCTMTTHPVEPMGEQHAGAEPPGLL